jgi:RsiW-degrading membrane proteinase PrsW (M82 family)
MSEADRAGWWAIVYLLMVGAAAYFTIVMIIFSFVKQLFWS